MTLIEMKKNASILSCILLWIAVIGCEETEQNAIQRPAPTLISASSKQSGKNQSVAGRVFVGYQLLAFQGDDLYRIHTDTKEVEFYGTYWGGTEAATIYNGNIYASVADGLWRGNLTTGVVDYLGCCWSGSTCMTNDGAGSLYVIQSPYLVKANASNGNWQILGPGDWSGSTEITYENHVGYLFIPWEGTKWRVNRNNGLWADYGAATLNPLVTPVGWSECFGISDGKLVYRGHYGGGGDITDPDWYGTTDISWTSLPYQPGVTSYYNVWLLKDGQIHHFRRNANALPSNYTYEGIVPGLTNVYKIVSAQGL